MDLVCQDLENVIFTVIRDTNMFDKKINLLNMDRKELLVFCTKLGERSFRAQQLMRWIYHDFCDDFNQMSDLGQSLRIKLNHIAEIRAPKITCEQLSIDGTIKWTMKVDNQQIETIYIPEDMRSTLCISSQIGCLLGCKFCNTGQQGFSRNLCVSEIVGQIWNAGKFIIRRNKINKKDNGLLFNNIVFMGMGEPLLNFSNVMSAIKIILDDYGFGLSKKRIHLSTAGVVPAIDKLRTMMNVSLSISLHAPNDIIRDQIMPINQKYNISCLLQSVRRYAGMRTASRDRVTIEYVLLKHLNDKISHAHQLAKQLINIPCKVNLIPWNPIPNTQYICSTKIQIDKFMQILLRYGITTTIRKIRGADINAACGQLSGKVFNRIKYI